jgi:hypothetical protein
MDLWHLLRLLLRWISDTLSPNAALAAENALLCH